MQIRQEALTLVRTLKSQLLQQQEGGTCLASLDDANFFRKSYTPPVMAREKPLVSPTLPPKVLPPQKVEKKVEEAPPTPIQRTAAPVRETFSYFVNFKTLLARCAPELALLKEVPDDSLAKRIAMRWKTKNRSAPISLLSFNEPPQQMAFLKNVTQALDVYFGPARLIAAEPIEKEKQWEAFLSVPTLKLIIVCDYTLWQLNAVLPFYREMKEGRMLGSVPLLLLPDLSLYLKDPSLKRSLWKALCSKLSS